MQRKFYLTNNDDKSDNENGSGHEDEVLANFMTIDSVGDMDGTYLLIRLVVCLLVPCVQLFHVHPSVKED